MYAGMLLGGEAAVLNLARFMEITVKLNHSLGTEKASHWRPVLHLRRIHVVFIALVLYWRLVLHGLFKGLCLILSWYLRTFNEWGF